MQISSKFSEYTPSLHYSTVCLPPIGASVPYFIQAEHTVPESHPAFCFSSGAILTNSATTLNTSLYLTFGAETHNTVIQQAGSAGNFSAGNLVIAAPTMLWPTQNSIALHLAAYSTPQSGIDSTGGFGMINRTSKVHVLSSKIDSQYGYTNYSSKVDFLTTDLSEKNISSVLVPAGYRYLVIGSFCRALTSGGSRSSASFTNISLKQNNSVLKQYADIINPTYQSTWSNIGKAVTGAIFFGVTDLLAQDTTLSLAATKNNSDFVSFTSPGIFAAPFKDNFFLEMSDISIDVDEVWVSYEADVTVSKGSKLLVLIPIFFSGAGASRVRAEVYVDGLELCAANHTELFGTASFIGYMMYTYTGGISHTLSKGQHKVSLFFRRGLGTYTFNTKPLILEIKN